MRGSKLSEPLRTSLFAIMQTAVGCGVGLLMAGKLGRPTQKITAASLLSVGFLLAVPGVVGYIVRFLNRPGSLRNEKRRLDTIRYDSGFPDEAEVF